MRILIIQAGGPLKRSGGITDRQIARIKKVGADIEVILADDSDAEFEKILADTEVLISSRFIDLDLKKTPKLKWIHLTSAGVNNLDPKIRDSEILVTNSSGVHPVPISEYVFGVMLMLGRGLDQAYRHQTREKRWIREFPYREVELFGKKLVVVGMGRIGTRVAELGKAFGMEVSGIVRNPEKHKGAIPVYKIEEVVNVLKDADFVVNALPATEETKNFFDDEKLSSFKKGAFFVNIGRGDTVNQDELVKKIKDHSLGGAALDVTSPEPLPSSSPLWEMENVIVTPHISGRSPNYNERMIEIFCQNLKAYLEKKKMPNLVDKKLGY